jgi:hypothetical protein
VVPYDGEATLFFGRPEQLYFNTRGSNNDQKKWNEARATAIQELEDSLDLILLDFCSTEQFFGGSHLLRDSTNIRRISQVGNAGFIFGEVQIDKGDYSRPLLLRPNDFSLQVHAIIDKWFRQHKTLPGLFAAERSSQLDYQPINGNEFAEAMLGRSFQEDFNAISDFLGGYQNTAILLLGRFFGMNYSYVSSHMDAVFVIREMLKKDGTNTISLEEILNNLSLRAQDEEEALNEIQGAIISEEAALSNLQILRRPEITQGLLNPGALIQNSQTSTRLRWIIDDSLISTTSPALGALKTYIEKGLGLPVIYGGVAGSSFYGLEIIASVNDTTELYSLALQSDLKPIIANAIRYFENVLSRLRTPSALEKSAVAGGDNINMLEKLGYSPVNFSSKKWASQLIDHIPIFRSFVHYLFRYMTGEISPGLADQNVLESVQSIQDSKVFDYRAALNMKVFRDYHYIRSGVDICENNIGASTREMFNSVVIRYPHEIETSNNNFSIFGFDNENFSSVVVGGETEWATWPNPDEQGHIGMQFNPDISLQDKKVAVYTDLNASRRDQCAMLATNVLTKMMRPMYRNNLKVIGRPIKPWDHILLDDKYVDMYGPLDVERVIHHYSVEDGWCTNIIPHAVCEANPNNKHVQAAIFNSKIDRINNIADYVMWGTVIATLFPVAGSLFSLGTKSAQLILKGVLSSGAGSAFGRRVIGRTASSAAGNLGRKIGGDVTVTSVTAQLDAIRSGIIRQGPAAIKALTYVIGLGGLGKTAISRYLIRNAGAGNNILPVTFSPLLYKGLPLTAGLAGDDVYYWSLGSRLHWAYKDFLEGVGTLFDAISNGFVPNKTRTQKVLEQLKLLDLSGRVNQ